jgi:hypothetical protein
MSVRIKLNHSSCCPRQLRFRPFDFYFLAMDIKLVLAVMSVVFGIACLFFGTKNGFYDTDKYHGNGSAH